MFTVIDGQEYPLATTLRVAYMVQGQHNHKPYTEVFKGIGDMTVEDQIGIIYAAFCCANPSVQDIKTGKMRPQFTREEFQNYYLDNYNLKDLMDQLQEVIKGIMGTTDEEFEAVRGNTSDADEGTAGE